MELCTATRCISNRPSILRPFAPCRTGLQWKFSLPLPPNTITANNPGSCYCNYSSIEATTSEETSSGANQYVKEEPDGVVAVVEVQSEEKSGFGGFGLMNDDSVVDEQFPQFDFLNKLDIQFDFEDSFSIALLGGGGIAAVWLTASIVGAIDNIPLFPKLMEVVGFGYTVWFSMRYLLFKKNRDELASKIEEIKQQVLGPKN